MMGIPTIGDTGLPGRELGMATDVEDGPSPQRDVRGDAVHPLLDLLVAYSWRLLVIGAATVALLWLLGQLRIVLIPLVVALLLSRVLSVPTSWLTRRQWRGGLAAGAVLVGFLALLAGGVAVISTAVADEVDDLGPTLSSAVDDVERWLAEDSPFDINRADIRRVRQDIGGAVRVWDVEGLTADGVTIRLVQTRPLAQWKVARELRARIKRAFDAEGIEILSISDRARCRLGRGSFG